ncbi:MAG: MFS transporter [Chloroflexota bacterium]
MATSEPFPTSPTAWPTPRAGVHVGRRLHLASSPSGYTLVVDVPGVVSAAADPVVTGATGPSDADSPGQNAGFKTVVRNKRFMSLWFAQIGSQLAANMALYALTLVAFALGGSSSTAVSLLFLAFLAPAVLLSAPAGVFVDRFDRRTILLATNLVRAVAFALIVVFADQLPLMYLMVIIAATATTFFIPAEAAMIPRVAPQEQLLVANGLFTFTLQAAFAVGFAVLGPLVVNLAGPMPTIAIAAGLYLVAAVLCLPLPSARPDRVIEKRSARAELAEGLSLAKRDPKVRWPLILLGFTASLIGVVGVLGPQVAVQQLGLSEQEFVLLVLPMAGGLVLGIAVMGALARHLSHRRLAELGLGGLALGLVLLALLRPLADLVAGVPRAQLMIAMPVAVMMGASYALIAVPAQTSLQEALPDAVRGRVFAVLNLLINAASAIPIVIVGPAADLVGVPVVVGACAVGTVAVGVASWFSPEPAAVGAGDRGAAHQPVAS